MSGETEFTPFKVTVPDVVRYWEDESTGVIIKRGQVVTINQRQMRSMELKFALMRNRVLMTEGQVIFAFKGQLVKLAPGEHKNLVTIIKDHDGKEVSIPMEKEMEYLKAKEALNPKEPEDDIEMEESSEDIPEELPDSFSSDVKRKAL